MPTDSRLEPITSSQYEETMDTFIFDCGTTKNSEKLQKELKTLAVFCDKRQHLLYLNFANCYIENETYR